MTPPSSTLPKAFSPISAARHRVDVWIQDPFLKTLYQETFQKENIDWHWEVSPHHWKTILKKQKPTVLVVDLSLFSENPIPAIQEIKSLSPQTEIIVLSHTEDVHTAISAFKSGISDYYLKPTNPETLLYAIQKLFSQKTLQPLNPILQADLQIFTVAHHISIADSDSKMRDLAVNHLLSSLQANGGIWLRPVEKEHPSQGSLFQEIEGTLFTIEHWGFSSSKEAQTELGLFQSKYPFVIRDSFLNHLTSHPEHWLRDDFAWIPLKNSSMGGILMVGISPSLGVENEARNEFLVRNLEVALENHRNFIEAKQLSYIDDLTGLYNSRFLDHILTIAMNSLQQKEEGFSVLFIDIDKFKSVNDQYGHLIGSQMLTHVGRLLKSNLRKNDHVFRYGGDEFIAVLFGTDIEKAKEIAERIRKSAADRVYHFPEGNIKVTLSIGIARFPDHGRDKSTVIALADHAMYTSKKKGRNQVVVADPPTHV